MRTLKEFGRGTGGISLNHSGLGKLQQKFGMSGLSGQPSMDMTTQGSRMMQQTMTDDDIEYWAGDPDDPDSCGASFCKPLKLNRSYADQDIEGIKMENLKKFIKLVINEAFDLEGHLSYYHSPAEFLKYLKTSELGQKLKEKYKSLTEPAGAWGEAAFYDGMDAGAAWLWDQNHHLSFDEVIKSLYANVELFAKEDIKSWEEEKARRNRKETIGEIEEEEGYSDMDKEEPMTEFSAVGGAGGGAIRGHQGGGSGSAPFVKKMKRNPV